MSYQKNLQYVRFSLYGFLKNLRFYDAFLLLFFVEKGLTYSQIGLLYASREILTNVFEVPSGIVADAYGRKNALLGAFLVYIMAFLTFYFSGSFWLLLLAMMLVGISDAFRSGTHKGMIMDYLRLNGWSAYKVDYYGHTRSWSQRGSALSALLAGLLVAFSGDLTLIFLASILPYLLNFANVATYPAELNHALKKKAEKTSAREVLRDAWQALHNRQLLAIMNSAALHSAWLKSVKDYIQPLMVQIAWVLPLAASLDHTRKNGLVIGLCYFIIFLLTSVASRNAGRVLTLNLKRIETKTLLLGLLAGLLCGFLYYMQFWGLALIVFVLIFLVENLRKPILTGLLADEVPPEILTSVISAQSFYQTLMAALISICLGVLADQFGIGVALAGTGLALILLTVWVNRRRTN